MSSTPAFKIFRFFRWLSYLDSSLRLFTTLAAATLVFLLLPGQLHLVTRTVITWDAGVIWFLLLTWTMIAGASVHKIKRYARHHDASSWVIFAFAVGAAFISLVAIIFLLVTAKGLPPFRLSLNVVLSLVSVLCSWVLLHTLFALRYAHIFYSDIDPSPRYIRAGGLAFPTDEGSKAHGEENPDYWDFIYYSFTIGMTFQVSDISITSRLLRKFSMLQAVLSFYFYTVVLGLTVSALSSLLS